MQKNLFCYLFFFFFGVLFFSFKQDHIYYTLWKELLP